MEMEPLLGAAAGLAFCFVVLVLDVAGGFASCATTSPSGIMNKTNLRTYVLLKIHCWHRDGRLLGRLPTATLAERRRDLYFLQTVLNRARGRTVVGLAALESPADVHTRTLRRGTGQR